MGERGLSTPPMVYRFRGNCEGQNSSCLLVRCCINHTGGSTLQMAIGRKDGAWKKCCQVNKKLSFPEGQLLSFSSLSFGSTSDTSQHMEMSWETPENLIVQGCCRDCLSWFVQQDQVISKTPRIVYLPVEKNGREGKWEEESLGIR
jgi:hypothetical protein